MTFGIDENGNLINIFGVKSGGGGGEGVTDHAQLTGRSKSSQHPISAITNLQTTLDGKISATDVATTSSVGVVKVDGTTITATEDGTISATLPSEEWTFTLDDDTTVTKNVVVV